MAGDVLVERKVARLEVGNYLWDPSSRSTSRIVRIEDSLALNSRYIVTADERRWWANVADSVLVEEIT